jgi:hypothetical protein
MNYELTDHPVNALLDHPVDALLDGSVGDGSTW